MNPIAAFIRMFEICSTPNKEMNNLMRYIDDGTVSDDTTAKIDNEGRVFRSNLDDFIEYIDTLTIEV